MRDGSVFSRSSAALAVVAAAVLVAGLIAALVYAAWIRAQTRAVVALSVVLEPPVLRWTVERATDEPRADEIRVSGIPATLVRPGGRGPWPALVFVNGATPKGRKHPRVQALADGLARAGYVVLVPDFPGVRTGEITTRTRAATVEVVRAFTERPESRDGRVGLLGVSVGGALALLAAQDRALAGRVSVVAAIAPYTDLVDVLRLATTGFYEQDGRIVRYDALSFLSLVAARSLVASLPGRGDRRSLLAELPEIDEVEEDEPDPLARLRVRSTRGLSPGARAVVALLRNRDPRRFEELYAALPPTLRTGHRELSPIVAADRLATRVEIASAPHDKYFPVAESRELAADAPDVRVTVTSTLAHAIPEPSPRAITDFFRLDAFVVRSLHAASAEASS